MREGGKEVDHVKEKQREKYTYVNAHTHTK